jgi:hypothetical protein
MSADEESGLLSLLPYLTKLARKRIGVTLKVSSLRRLHVLFLPGDCIPNKVVRKTRKAIFFEVYANFVLFSCAGDDESVPEHVQEHPARGHAQRERALL